MFSGGEGPKGEYVPGDEIKLGVAFTSDAKITAVEVVYAHPIHQWITLALEGGAELMEDSPSFGMKKRSRAAVSGVVEEHHEPGIYSVVRAVFYTFTGRSIAYDYEDTQLRKEHQTLLPGSWPELSISRPLTQVSNVIVELEPEGG